MILAKKYSTAQNWESTDSDAHLFVLEEDRAIASQENFRLIASMLLEHHLILDLQLFDVFWCFFLWMVRE